MRHTVILYLGSRKTQAYPGVAKFGIALEWGSRGLEFESRHSDQDRNGSCCFGLFLLCNDVMKRTELVKRFNDR